MGEGVSGWLYGSEHRAWGCTSSADMPLRALPELIGSLWGRSSEDIRRVVESKGSRNVLSLLEHAN